MPRPAAFAMSTVMRTSSGGPALTITCDTPGTASIRGLTVFSINCRYWSTGPCVPGSNCTKNQLSVSFAPPPPLPPSCTTGRSASFGIERTRLSLPITSTIAFFMSVPIANVRLMKLPPEPALPSSSSMPGRPCSTCSCGSSSSDSTSSGEAARQLVWIEICGRSISGKSCSGNSRRLRKPKIATRTTTMPTATGFLSEASMIFMRATPGNVRREWAADRGVGCG